MISCDRTIKLNLFSSSVRTSMWVLPVPRALILFVLLEQDPLRSSVFGSLKVAQTNANKPITLLRTKINPLSQLQGDARQLPAGGGWGVWCMAANNDLELAGLQLKDNRACRP